MDFCPITGHKTWPNSDPLLGMRLFLGQTYGNAAQGTEFSLSPSLHNDQQGKEETVLSGGDDMSSHHSTSCVYIQLSPYAIGDMAMHGRALSSAEV